MSRPFGELVDRSDHQEAIRHLSGPIALAAFAAAYNVHAYRNGRPTISAGIRWLAVQDMGAEIAGAIAGGLLAHWFLRLLDAE